MEKNAKMLIADALNGVGMLIESDNGYLDLLCGDESGLIGAAVVGRDKEGRVLLQGNRVASGLEHEIYDAIRLDRLDEKWSVDGAELLTQLRAMTPAERRALVLDIAAAWSDLDDNFNAKVEKAGQDAGKPERVDGFLSRKMQTVRPGALVYEKSDGTWLVRGGGEDLLLGKSFHDAAQAVNAMRSAGVSK